MVVIYIDYKIQDLRSDDILDDMNRLEFWEWCGYVSHVSL